MFTRTPDRFRVKRAPRRAGLFDEVEINAPLQFPEEFLAEQAPNGGEPDNLLKKSARDQTLNLKLQLPDGSDDNNELFPESTFWLVVNKRPHLIGQIVDLANPDELYALTIPFTAEQRGTIEAVHKLTYEIHVHPSDGRMYGPEQQYILDFTAPGDPALAAPVPVDTSIISDGLTSDKLQTDDDGLQYMDTYLPGYTGMAAGDKVMGYINGQEVAKSLTVTEVGENMKFPFYRSDIEAAGDGELLFTYRVTDRAENISIFSDPLKLTVLLEGEITDLQSPQVPEHDDDVVDKLINDADARPDVRVIIPGNARIQAGDFVQLFWGDQKLPKVPVREEDVGSDPLMQLDVEYRAVYADWDATSKGNNSVVVSPVSYQILRGTGEVPAGVSPSNNVAVNLYLPGGPEPELGIKKLLAPVVSGDNNIDVEESKVDSDVAVPWLNADGNAYLLAGDAVEVFYGTQPAIRYTVSAQDVEDKVDLSINLPQASIAAEGAGTIVTYYTVTRNVAGGSSNTSVSPDTQVTVVTPGVLPGNGTLQPGKFEPLNRFGVVGYDEVVNQIVKFIIPVYENMKAGDKVTLNYSLALGSGHKENEEPIEGTELTKEYTLSQSDVNQRVEFVIERQYLEASRTQMCHAEPLYTITNSYGTVTAQTSVTIVYSKGETPPGRKA